MTIGQAQGRRADEYRECSLLLRQASRLQSRGPAAGGWAGEHGVAEDEEGARPRHLQSEFRNPRKKRLLGCLVPMAGVQDAPTEFGLIG